MKLQLNESTLNAYINEAIRQELNENSMDELFGSRVRKQSRRMITGQGWGNQNAAKNRNDISQTDANEDCPQTLVGMISKLESILVASENLVGINGVNQNLAGGVEKRGWLGGFKMKQSLINAINALTTIANRINAIERKTGLNNIMEGIKEILDPLGATGWTGQGIPATTDSVITHGPAVAGNTTSKTVPGQAVKPGALKTIFKKAGSAAATAGKWAVTPLKAGATGVAGALTTPLAIATAAFAIAQAASVAATKGRQRNIVRTYNCAAILAKRLGNIAKQLESSNQQNTASAPLEEINVRRGMKSFESIEAGMQELSNIMRQIGGISQGTAHNRIVEIPEGLDLNTREGILAFQQWVNSIPIADANGNPLTEDGIFGRNTNYVYDRIAQMLQQQGQSQIHEGVIKESKAVETALANLERVAGATGSGGNAYSSIGAMSGGANASRLQNAQNIKNIIRTYPPVLNQYLNILSDAGADVSTLQPLNVDTRPHRNYSVKELQAIDARIKELLQIARTVEIPEGESGEGSIIIKGTLPPKPNRRPQPRPQPNPNPEPPVPELPELDPVEIQDEPIELEDIVLQLDDELPEVPFMVNPYSLESYGIIPNDKSGRMTKRELKQKIRDAVQQGKLTPERAQELIRKVKQDYRNGVAQRYTNSDGTVVPTTDNARRADMKQDRENMRVANRTPQYMYESKRGKAKNSKALNEQAFKKLVKQIIKETMEQ